MKVRIFGCNCKTPGAHEARCDVPAKVAAANSSEISMPEHVDESVAEMLERADLVWNDDREIRSVGEEQIRIVEQYIADRIAKAVGS